MADLEENVSPNEEVTLGGSNDEDTKCTLNEEQNEDTPKTFKDLVGLSEAENHHRHLRRAKQHQRRTLLAKLYYVYGIHNT